MRIFILLFFLFYLIILLQWKFVEGMIGQRDPRKGKGVMEGSSRDQQPVEFALPELTLLIEILGEIKYEYLTSQDSFIDILNKHQIEDEFDNKFDMDNQPATKQKIEKVIEFYKQMIPFTSQYNHYCFNAALKVYLLFFARKLIRSFFDFHRIDKYYDNRLVNENSHVSLLQYLKAYDLFECLAINLMTKMKIEFGINIFPNSLKELENRPHYPPRITNLDNWNPDNQTMINFIYQYEAINEELNREDCQELYKKCKHPRRKNEFIPFYKYFYELDHNLQLKLEQYLISPFLSEDGYEYRRTQMLNLYMSIEENDYVHHNQYLPQQRIYITVHVQFLFYKL
uniref:Uncharacterized protein n=1 Tax=Meloidogyne enterolobii TaxID=390850 RepID=A0A6V7WAB3_MELEN|nr:unnamed protein product [Meloidogyne enterolobii]